MALPDSDKVTQELNRRFNVAERNIMELKKNYKKTQLACYLGFVTQAICANFVPLLFITRELKK
jgi:hypothetical protein